MATFAHILERRKERQNVSAFTALIQTPASVNVTMPAGARVSFVATAGVAAGSTLATVTGSTNRTIKSRLLAVNGRQVLDYLERGSVVALSAGIHLYVDAGLSRWVKIAGNP